MIKEMKGWKVISKHRESCRVKNWWGHQKKWAIDYPVNVEVFPKVEGTKLFFFKEECDAQKFALWNEKVVPCIAKDVVRVKWVGRSINNVVKFWESRSKSKHKKEAPSGTYLAESITCLE